MKYVLIIPDGAADEPQASLQGKTPLEAARTPAMDTVATAGAVGLARHVPDFLPAGSAVATMSLLGYNPSSHFTGRAPLEAAAQGIKLGPHDWAVRCNLVTIEQQVMRDFTADHISTQEAEQLLRTAQEQLAYEQLTFVTGVSYRNLLLCRGAPQPAPFSNDTRTTPPHDLTEKSVLEHYPRGPGSDLLNDVMSDSVALFAQHRVNQKRQAMGKLPATNVWLWGQGKKPDLQSFEDTYGKRGAMITAVDLLKGLAELIGWQQIDVVGATGYTDTDYAAKGTQATAALNNVDIICVHIEAPDEASHEGNCEAKIRSLEQIDQHIVAPLYTTLSQTGNGRILISPDHPTSLRTRMHSYEYVPFTIAGTGVESDNQSSYGETTATQSGWSVKEGWKLMKHFLQH